MLLLVVGCNDLSNNPDNPNNLGLEPYQMGELDNPPVEFCLKKGGEYKAVESGDNFMDLCVKDNKECDLLEHFDGKCIL